MLCVLSALAHICVFWNKLKVINDYYSTFIVMANSTASSLTGYGRSRLYYDGDESKYELWEIKFLAHLRLQGLIDALTNAEITVDQNAKIFAELILVLDDKSLSLVMRDAKDKGKQAIEILREHYLGKSKPRIISLYRELASLKMAAKETVTEYMIRAENYATALKTAKETISDSLLIAMVLKGLPPNFDSFSTVITQRDDEIDFPKFKACLRSFEENEQSRNSQGQDRVMKFSSKSDQKIVCFSCGELGHKKYQCERNKNVGVKSESKKASQKTGRWCDYCKTKTHDTGFCRRRNVVKSVSDDANEHSFAFKTVFKNVDDANLDKVNNTLLVDSGATSHIICNKSQFVNFDDRFEPKTHYIELADGARSNDVVKARGDAIVNVHDSNGNKCDLILQDALLVPSYSQDIFSVQAATENGAELTFSQNDAQLKARDGTCFDIVKRGKLYFMYNVKSNTTVAKSLSEWHRIFGHCNVQDLIKLENSVEGMKITNAQEAKNFKCEVCLKGKMQQNRNRLPDKRATSVLELVHCDLAGPITPAARDGFQYAINFVDDFSGTIFVYFLKHKDDAPKAFEQFLADTASYGTVTRLRCDNGGEFSSAIFRDIATKNKIRQEFSCPNSPHQNGSAERCWRSLFEMGRCLLLDAGLPKSLWTYAVRYAAFVRNRCYTARLDKTPYEALTGLKPNVNKMEIFGSECYAYVQNKKKLDDRCQAGKFVGFDNMSPAYLVYLQEENSIRRVRCVEFLSPSNTVLDADEDDIYLYPNSPDKVREKKKVDKDEEKQQVKKDEEGISTEQEESQPRYPARERRAPKHLDEYLLDEAGNGDDSFSKVECKYSVDYCYRISTAPSSYQEALQSPEASDWKVAMDEEIATLKDNDTYTLTPLPKDKSVIGGRWVYDIRPGVENNPKFKARFVAKGFSQVKDRDFNETFAPTAKLTSLRMLLQMAAQQDLLLHTMDVKAAYLNAEIDFDLYVSQPEGYEIYSDNGEKLVCKLNRSLYGLRQSGRNWNALLDEFLKENGFDQSKVDPCIYICSNQSSVMICLVWVDDLLICSNNEAKLMEFKGLLSKRFKMKDMGILKWFLGIKFEYEPNCIKMSQTDFIERLLSKFSMNDSNPKTLPCDVNINKFDFEDSKLLDDPRIYREIVGSLIYLMTCSRPDLSYVVTKLSQYMSKPTDAHLKLARNVLKYLKGTMMNKLSYEKSSEPLELIGYCDSDWAGSEDRKSISGFCYCLSKNGSLISWKTKKQNVVSLSSCEAEYTALSFAIQEGNFLSQLFADFCVVERNLFHLNVDNQGAIHLANNQVCNQRSKHIDVKYHYIRHEIKEGHCKLLYVPSKKNLADMFTKAVPRPLLNSFNIFSA